MKFNFTKVIIILASVFLLCLTVQFIWSDYIELELKNAERVSWQASNDIFIKRELLIQRALTKRIIRFKLLAMENATGILTEAEFRNELNHLNDEVEGIQKGKKK